MTESYFGPVKVGPWPHLGPSSISKGRARALLGPCHATPLFGRRLESDDPKLEEMLTLVRRLVREFFEPMVINRFPFLRFHPKYKKVMEKCKKLDRDTFSLLEEMIDMSASDANVESFAKSYGYSKSPLSDNSQLLYTVRDMYIAGTDGHLDSVVPYLHGKQSHSSTRFSGGTRCGCDRFPESVSG